LTRTAPYHLALGTLTPGSADIHRIREELLALAVAGERPLLFVTEPLEPIPSVETVTVPGGGPLGLFESQNLRKEILAAAARRPPSCLHAHGHAALRKGHRLAREIGVPLVGDLLRGGVDREDGGDRAVAAADRLVTPVASLARRLESEARPGSVWHLPGSLDANDLPSAPPVPFRLPADRELLLAYAPLDEGDPNELLPALDAALAARPALHLVILGEPIGAPFMKAVSAHRMVPHVTFGGLPPLPAVARLYGEARGVLVALADPTAIEAHALLAAASGIPILALETDDARALLGEAARYAPRGAVPALQGALVETLARGPRPPAALPARFRRAALAARLQDLYRGLGPGEGPSPARATNVSRNL
jgi:hypothetical protein